MVSVDALVSYAQELEDDTAGTGLAWLKARRDEALGKINGGGGSDFISTTVNGQTFTRRFTSTSIEWFEALQLAIAQLAGTSAKITYPTFSNIPH